MSADNHHSGAPRPEINLDDRLIRKIYAGERTFYPEAASSDWYGSFLTHLQRTNGRKFKDQLAEVLRQNALWLTHAFDIPEASRDPALKAHAVEMREQGYTYFRFPAEAVDAVKSGIGPARYGNPAAGTKQLTFRQVLEEGTQTAYSTSHASAGGEANILDYPAVARIAQNPAVLRVLRDHLGALPMVGGFEVTLSHAGRSGPVPSGDWHADKGAIAFSKMFIYLNDVSPDSGPHAFAAGSHDRDNIERILDADPALTERQRAELLNRQRWSPELVEKYFAGKQIFHTGAAGLAILEDTRGLHRGTELTAGYRWMITLQWSLDPLTLYLPKRRTLESIDPTLVPDKEPELSRFLYLFSRYVEKT